MAVSPASVKGDAISLGITPLRGAFDETLRLVMKLVMKRRLRRSATVQSRGRSLGLPTPNTSTNTAGPRPGRRGEPLAGARAGQDRSCLVPRVVARRPRNLA
jgi:hypothetical protein